MISSRVPLRVAHIALLSALLGFANTSVAQSPDSASLIDPDELNIEEDELEGGAWPGGVEAFEALPFEVSQDVGVVAEMDPSGPFVLVDGVRYGFTVDADIRLRSGFGAPTLLQPGMVLEFYFADTLGDAVAGNIVAAIELENTGDFAD